MIFRPWFCALAAGLVLPLPGHAQPATDVSSLTRAAEGFYTAYRTIPPGGIPDIDARAKLEPFLSPALDKLLGEGETAQMRYAKATKNMSPPLIEGDLFTSLFEGATSFKVGACLSDGRGGHCQVTLGYLHGQDKPLAWTDTVYLVRVGSGWGGGRYRVRRVMGIRQQGEADIHPERCDLGRRSGCRMTRYRGKDNASPCGVAKRFWLLRGSRRRGLLIWPRVFACASG